MLTNEQAKALRELCSFTHTFWSPESARNLTKPFGFECVTRVWKANPRDPKGLTFNDGSKEAEGAASWEVSGQIVSHYNLNREQKIGRGFQVRADCDVIRKYLLGGDAA